MAEPPWRARTESEDKARITVLGRESRNDDLAVVRSLTWLDGAIGLLVAGLPRGGDHDAVQCD